MKAYKFLARGAIGPFRRRRWPLPAPEGPQAWAEAEGPGAPVCAARTADLPYWLNEELWEIELDGALRPRSRHLEAERGRLLRRVEAWTPQVSRAFGEACMSNARGRALAALRSAGLAAAADCLARAATLEALQAAQRDPAVASSALAAELAGYLAEGGMAAGCGSIAGAPFVAAVAAAAAAGEEAGYGAERAWQARWLTERLGLDA